MNPVLRTNVFLRNIYDYFERQKIVSDGQESLFAQEAYKVYQMVLENATEEELFLSLEKLRSLPLSYSEMRAFFG